MVKRRKNGSSEPILLPCFMKIIYLFFGGVTFKFILASLATNNMEQIYGGYDNETIITLLNSVVSFLDNILWYSLAFLLIQKSSSKRAFLRSVAYGFIFAIILCAIYGYSYSKDEPIAWNLSSILLLIYYGLRVFVCIILTAFMYTRRHNHNRWKRWASLRFLVIFLFSINIAYMLAVIAMSIKNCQTNEKSAATSDIKSDTVLLDICWFTLVELVRNLIQPFILYGTLLKDTDYWRKLTKLLTMSSAIEVPRRGGTLDLSIENYKDIEAFANTTRVPVLDFTEFELRKPIGRGSTASVYRAYYRGYPVACKDLTAIMFDEITYEVIHRFCREALLFIHIEHINIIKFFGVCLRPPSLYLVFELATHGTLRNLLDSSKRKRKRALRRSSNKRRHKQSTGTTNNKNSPLSWQEKLWIALDIATGMQVLHHKDIIHRDLNTNNVLVTFMKEEGRLVAKICDFGLARKLRPHHQDRVNSSFLMTSPVVKTGNDQHTFPFPNLPSANNIYRKTQQRQHQQKQKQNSLPGVLVSGSLGSVGGADNMNGLTTPEMNKELSSNSHLRNKNKKSKKHKNKKHKKHKKLSKQKSKRNNKSDEDESPPSIYNVSVSISNNVLPLPPKHIDALPEHDEHTPVTPQPNTPPQLNTNATLSTRNTISMQDMGNSLDALTTECGTVAYMAPELLEHLNITKHFAYATENLVLYTKSIDVYSFGLILWELCTENILYEDFDNLKDIRQYVLNGGRPHIPSYILGTYASLMKDCWSQSPLHRPDFNEIVKRLHLILGLRKNKSEDNNSLYSWTLVDAMRDSGRYE